MVGALPMAVVIVIDLGFFAPGFMHADRNGRIIGIHQSRAHTCRSALGMLESLRANSVAARHRETARDGAQHSPLPRRCAC